MRDIVVNLGVPIKGRRVLLLGTGGAARGALGLFLAEEPAELVLAHRSPEKAEALCVAHAGNKRADRRRLRLAGGRARRRLRHRRQRHIGKSVRAGSACSCERVSARRIGL